MRVKIVIPNASTEFRDSQVGERKKAAGPENEVEIVCLTHGPVSIESSYDEALAAPHIIEEVKKAEKEGYDAVSLAFIFNTVDRSYVKWSNEISFPGRLGSRKDYKMRITTPTGTDVSFENAKERPMTNELRAGVPGPHFLVGQIGWAPREESISGIVVFDGSFSGGGEADLGVLARPIELVVKKGRVVEINGEDETKKMSAW